METVQQNDYLVSWVLLVSEELYGDFEDLETGVVHKGKCAAEGDEV